MGKASRRLMFTTQTGAKFDLKEDQLENVFSKHGKVVKYKIFKKSNMGFDGFVEFSSCLVTDRLVNTLVEVGDCQLHCSPPWEQVLPSRLGEGHDHPELLQQVWCRHRGLHDR